MIERARKTATIFCKRRGIPADLWEDYQQEAVLHVIEKRKQPLGYYLQDYRRKRHGTFIDGKYDWSIKNDTININTLSNSINYSHNGTSSQVAAKDAILKIFNTMTLTSRKHKRDISIMLEYLTTKPTMRKIGRKYNITESRVSQIIKSTLTAARKQVKQYV